ncbi:hypothetical protein Y1Q_0006568 [Alligator mississippiensis]|uniref:Uncharacterized protein n=1 Tax=Alligator mississippiensis TaxID=8496 RepID=A0A151NTE8_ALLMI|nr:hypothetical protein Y1Q_0006568 [Alligator mississippiensis]
MGKAGYSQRIVGFHARGYILHEAALSKGPAAACGGEARVGSWDVASGLPSLQEKDPGLDAQSGLTDNSRGVSAGGHGVLDNVQPSVLARLAGPEVVGLEALDGEGILEPNFSVLAGV